MYSILKNTLALHPAARWSAQHCLDHGLEISLFARCRLDNLVECAEKEAFDEEDEEINSVREAADDPKRLHLLKGMDTRIFVKKMAYKYGLRDCQAEDDLQAAFMEDPRLNDFDLDTLHAMYAAKVCAMPSTEHGPELEALLRRKGLVRIIQFGEVAS